MLACVVLLFVGVALGQQFNDPLTFTGDAEKDFLSFGGVLKKGVVTLDDPTIDAFGNEVLAPDVGVPPGWPFPFSGWDIKNIYFQIDFS